MPRRDERFMGPRDRNRARVRQRRRQVFVVLLDAIALTFLMGLVPPLRVMLVVAGVLTLVLLAYTAMLVQIKAEEAARAARLARARARGEVPEPTYRPASVAAMSRAAVAGSPRLHPAPPLGRYEYGVPNGNGHANGNGNGHANGHGNGNGQGRDNGRVPPLAEPDLGATQWIDEDLHVIVRRAADVEAERLEPAAT